MAELWQTQQVLKAINGEIIAPLPDNFDDISIDSRTVGKNGLFFAIKGDRFDGHQFVKQALANGAAGAVVSQDYAKEAENAASLIIVPDVLAALNQLAIAARQRSRAKIIAVTGSVGKTTTKEALAKAFGYIGKVHANPASFNNHWGVPLTLARMPADCDFGIFELGMNHANEIRPLAKMVKPHLAIITCIAGVHLENFKNLDGIAQAKAEIFEGVATGGAVLLNGDDDYAQYLTQKAKEANIEHIGLFGAHANADYRLLDMRLFENCGCFKVAYERGEALVKIGAPGRHMVQNGLCAFGAGDMLGQDLAKIALGLAQFAPQKGRGQRFELSLDIDHSFSLIDESYNANPTSMRAALVMLGATKPMRRGRRIGVLGDMLELGQQSQALHKQLLGAIVDAKLDGLFLFGRDMKELAQLTRANVKTVWRDNASEIQSLLLSQIEPDDVIMIKSSHSSGAHGIVEAILARYKSV